MTTHNPFTSISATQKSPHHEVNLSTKITFKWNHTQKFKFKSKYLLHFILIKLGHFQRGQFNLNKHNTEKREHIHHKHQRKKKGSLLNRCKESEVLAVPSCSTFSQVTKKEDVAHTGEVWVAGPKAEGTGQRCLLCVLYFGSSLPFEQNDVWASTSFCGHSVWKAWKCWTAGKVKIKKTNFKMF